MEFGQQNRLFPIGEKVPLTNGRKSYNEPMVTDRREEVPMTNGNKY